MIMTTAHCQLKLNIFTLAPIYLTDTDLTLANINVANVCFKFDHTP